MKTDIEILDWNVGKIYQSKDKEGRKTVDEVFSIIKKTLNENKLEKKIKGSVRSDAFGRLTK